MDINKILEAQNNQYQLTVARSILSFSRADAATQAQLLDSYRAIIREYEDEEYYNREMVQNQGLDIDQYLDDPRHGQSSKGEH
jgi:hypothetical protein